MAAAAGVTHSKGLGWGEEILDHVLCIIFKSPELQEDEGGVVVVVVLNFWLFCASTLVGNLLKRLILLPPVTCRPTERHFLFHWNWGRIQCIPSMLWDLDYFCCWYLALQVCFLFLFYFVGFVVLFLKLKCIVTSWLWVSLFSPCSGRFFILWSSSFDSYSSREEGSLTLFSPFHFEHHLPIFVNPLGAGRARAQSQLFAVAHLGWVLFLIQTSVICT